MAIDLLNTKNTVSKVVFTEGNIDTNILAKVDSFEYSSLQTTKTYWAVKSDVKTQIYILQVIQDNIGSEYDSSWEREGPLW